MTKLFGEFLRDTTSVTSSQIVGALRSQIVLKDDGETRLLGDLLIEAGHVTREEVNEALRKQRLAQRSGFETSSFGQFVDAQIH